ncbi:MAG: response regulator [Anaerolineae bacterium]|nr:response regulator [Anaerolineae bacterium]
MVKILVVEDDHELGHLIVRILMAMGYEVIWASNGTLAINFAVHYEPDLITMDIAMPGVNGYEVMSLLTKLAEIEITSFIPVIFLSAYDDDTTTNMGFDLGAVDYITKPFDIVELGARIQDIFDGISELAKIRGLSEAEARKEFIQRIQLRQLNIKQWVTSCNIFIKKKIVHHLVIKAFTLHMQLCEAGMIISGIVHDLRNIIGVAEANVRGLTLYSFDRGRENNFINELKRLSYLIEDLGELRYTSYWSPRWQCQNGILEGIYWIKDYYPKFTIEISTNSSHRIFYYVKHQVQQAFLNLIDLLVAISVDRKVMINQVKDGEWIFETKIATDLDWETIHNPEYCTKGNLNTIRYFIVDKLAIRQGGNLNSELDSRHLTLHFSLPTNTPPNPLDETALADLDAQIAAIPSHATAPLSQTESNLHLLFVPVCAQLFTLIDRLEQNLQELVSEIKENKAWVNMGHSLRFTRLLIRNLLITVAGYEPELKSLNIKPLVVVVINLLRSKLLQSVEVNIPDDLSPILADELGIMQIVLNLLTNAGEATDEDGKIAIQADYVEDTVRLEIEDTGHGIPSEVIKRIFELDYSTKTGQQRGVGLYVVKSIVDRLGAHIEVFSEVDKGTKFRILFPSR